MLLNYFIAVYKSAKEWLQIVRLYCFSYVVGGR